MEYNVNVMLETAYNNCGYPRNLDEPIVVTRGARNPEKFDSLELARKFQQTLLGSTLTYKIIVPARERLEVMARLAKLYPARKK